MPPADLDCRGRYLKLPIHVAMVNGDDGAEGTEGHPVKTLARAAALVKTLDISERQKTPRRACEPFGGRGPVPVIQSNGSAYESLPVIRMHCSGNGCRMVTCSHPGCCDQLCGKHGAGVGYFMDIDNCDGVRPISMQDYENLARYGASHDYNESVFVKFLEWSQNCIVDFCDAWYCATGTMGRRRSANLAYWNAKFLLSTVVQVVLVDTSCALGMRTNARVHTSRFTMTMLVITVSLAATVNPLSNSVV